MSPTTLETMMKFVQTIARPKLVILECCWCGSNTVDGRGWDEVEARKDVEAQLKSSGWKMVEDDDGERYPCCKFCVDRVVGTKNARRVR